MATRTFAAPVRICLAGEDLDWLGPHHCCCVPVSLYTEASVDDRADAPYCGEYLASIWAVLSERFDSDLGSPPRVVIKSHAPVNSGLASSSSLTVALIRACLAHLGHADPTPMEIADVGYEAEFRLTHGGGMDQLTIALERPAYIQGRVDGPPRLLSTFKWPKEITIVLLDPSLPKNTAPHIEAVRTQMKTGCLRLLKYIKECDDCAVQSWHALSFGKATELFASVNRAHELMRDIQCMSTIEIERIRAIALDSGCNAVKLTGAGGGGCLFALINGPAGIVCNDLRRRLDRESQKCAVMVVDVLWKPSGE